MTNVIPNITVKSEIKKVINENPLLRDVVCLIGAFEDDETVNTPVFCTELTEAEKTFGDDKSIDANAALARIMTNNEITGCLIVNVTTSTGSGENKTYQRNITKKKLEDALATVKLIDFDEIFVASELSDELLTVLDDFCNDRFEAKRSCDYVAVGARSTEAAYISTIEKVGDRNIGFLTQPLQLNEEELALVESGAYLTYVIATLEVGNSLTAKVLEDVTGVATTYTFDDGDLGKKLVNLGYFVVRLIDALNNTYECVNSSNPNGLDLYMTRVTSYIVNEFALRDALGERNRKSMQLIENELARLKFMFTDPDQLDLVKDIVYTVQKVDAETVEVIIQELVFEGTVKTINVSIQIEVD